MTEACNFVGGHNFAEPLATGLRKVTTDVSVGHVRIETADEAIDADRRFAGLSVKASGPVLNDGCSINRANI